jgi:uncharacterized protein GlcG (DUF336 family)
MKTISTSGISLQAATLMAEAAIESAKSQNLKIAVTILDESGNEKLYMRMDGAPLVAIDACRKKAMTAIGFGIPTGEAWYNFIKDDPILLHGAQQLKNFILLGGGAPVMHDGCLVGAIGVSGGHYHQDEKCVAAALSAFEK